MKKSWIVVVSLLIAMLLTTNVKGYEQRKSLILVVTPGFSFEEVEWLVENGDQQLWRKAAFSALNVRPEGSYSYLSNTVSLSTGIRGVGVDNWNAYEKGEFVEGNKAEELLLQWTGTYPQDSLLHPYFHKLIEKNNSTTFRAPIGILGETLKNEGVNRYVLGTSDLSSEERVRYGSLFAVDKTGEVQGELTNVVEVHSKSPAGLRMNQELLLDEIIRVETESDSRSFIVVEWGDFHRLFSTKNMMTSTHFVVNYEQALVTFEQFLYKLVDNQNGRNVMLLAPMMHTDAYKEKKQLSPFFYWDTSNQQPRELYSQTTKQRHIISNVDIVPTILSSFDIEVPPPLPGVALDKVELTHDNHEEVIENVNWIFKIYSTRSVILSSYITLLVLMLISVGILLWRKKTKPHWLNAGKIILLAAVSSPIWYLFLSKVLLYVHSGYYFWLLTLLSILVAWLLLKFTKYPLVILGVAQFMVITVDLWMGSPLMQRSYLGYDPIIGARYYGIGNEYAGVYMISGLLMLIPFWKASKRTFLIVTTILFGFLIYMLGASHLGTNAGATLSAATAWGFIAVKHSSLLKKWKVWLPILVFAIPSLSLALLFLLQMNGHPTHIGYAFERLLSGDFSYIIDVIKRKLQMNWKIFKFSNWTQLFVTSYILMGIILWRQKNWIKNEREKDILQSMLVTSVALLLLNDSGVVAAATSMFLIVATSYYWLLDEKETSA
ncbi:hypothetical protein [Alkalihalobacterium elongatum]|uniref:hypothetical protein n=1 Tax=Alkalihalobacterium elongatum TaxID=2675466 RepID=UPI001C1FF0B0|nr:hypothetical protein [Alkalihalobacterium elongatum]